MLDREILIEGYCSMHPRFFFKLPENSKFLNVGAGSRRLVRWRTWFKSKREDIKIYAVDIKKGDLFDFHKGYRLMDIEKHYSDYLTHFFDATILSHVIEHIKDPQILLIGLKNVIKPCGLIYLERPSLFSTTARSKNIYGCLCSISNLYDDSTHVSLYNLEQIKSILSNYNFVFIADWLIINKFMENRLYNVGLTLKGQEVFTYAVWLKHKFAEYAVFQKILEV